MAYRYALPVCCRVPTVGTEGSTMRDYTLAPDEAAGLIRLYVLENRDDPEVGFPVSGDSLRTNKHGMADAFALVMLDPLPPQCDWLNEYWGPADGCAEFMDAPEHVERCSADGTERRTYDDPHGEGVAHFCPEHAAKVDAA